MVDRRSAFAYVDLAGEPLLEMLSEPGSRIDGSHLTSCLRLVGLDGTGGGLELGAQRGNLGTFAWLVEEIGELSRALRRQERDNLEEEFGDCFAWLASLASMNKIDLATAAQKYARGCPRCQGTPCSCPMRA